MKPIKPDLDLIIQRLEAEAKTLKRMIKYAAAEHDNLIVYYHSEALLELNRKLAVFYGFRDPDFEKKEDLKRQINFLKKHDNFKKSSPQMREWVKKRFAQKAEVLEKDLQQLIGLPPAAPKSGTLFFDDAMLALYQKRCRKFQLLLGDKDDDGLMLTFQIKKKILTIELSTELCGEDPDFVFENRVPQPLKAAGFTYGPERRKYIRTFDITGFNNTHEVKKWLAKFIIDDSRYYWPGRKMTMIYK